MAKRIVWSIRAKTDRREILEYWHCRNKSKAYSQKLFRYFQETLVQISKTPTIGKPTSALGVRSMVVRDYLIIYEFMRNSGITSLFSPCGIAAKARKEYEVL